MDHETVRAALAERIERDGMRQTAAQLGFSTTFLRQVELGYAPVSERLGEALGYRRVVTWERIERSGKAA